MSRPYRSRYTARAAPTPTQDVTKDLQQAVKRFTPSTTTTGAIKISDVEAVASYSWLDEPSPTILVPDCPAVWIDDEPERVPADTGRMFVDQNSARMGASHSPLAPMFAAIQDLGKTEKLRGLDLVTDRNSLRKLLRWATRAGGLKDFRIDIEVARGTVLFTRTEEEDSEVFDGFRGFGQEYLKHATAPMPGSEMATGHHRIITMSLGGIQVMVRFTVDACTMGPDAEDEEEDGDEDEDEEDTLTAAFSSLTTNARQFPGLTIQHSASRTIVPQSTLIELKTRASHKALDWEETYPQLYLSQTPYLYLAKHDRGAFRPAEKYDVAGRDLRPYAEQAEVGMVQLRDALLQILGSAREEGEGVGLSLVCQGEDLALYRRKEGTGRAVGKDILAMFQFRKK
ncbi:hypothetical protein FRB94_004264 [Tulasnella sp. JGI-2019a]|nr:hypothetical protein FRB93_000265 [Tulasnella sp. JGI-2019a]KAG9015145.1 hypothetical protein FRB94_004264 [Tulasnella sp. JGI-2019a]KAG9039214.1 hypothetical protein FRB95_011799 [Tulasnella sp. JGI-2019a]